MLAAALLCACDHDHPMTPGPMFHVGAGGLAIEGSGVPATETRALPDFAAMTVTAPFRVVLAPGPPSLAVTADDNVLPFVRSEVRGGVLYLDFDRPLSLTRTREILCRVTFAELREVEASGAAVVEVIGVDAGRLSVDLSGASAGSGTGAVGELSLRLSGASRWTAASLRAGAAWARLSGASFALQRVADALDADVSGASTLEYLGDPVVRSSATGASVVRRVGP
jgi:hypothetical protein